MAALALGSAFATAAGAQAINSKPMIVATGIDSTFAPFVVAVKKGFFEKEGVNAELKSFTDGNFALDALLTGEADIGATSELGGLSRMARGGKLYIVGSQTQSDAFNALVGKSTIATPKDLEGKTVGIPGAASGANLFMSLVMKRYEIDPTKITFKYLQAPESIAALSRGDIDAVAVWEPWPTRTIATVPNTKVIVRSSKDLFPLTQYMYVSQRMVDNPELARRSLKAIITASRWIAQNFDEAVVVVADAYRLKVADAEPIMKLVRHNVHFSVDRFESNFAAAGEFGKSVKLFDRVPDFKAFMHPELLKEVAPDRVN